MLPFIPYPDCAQLVLIILKTPFVQNADSTMQPVSSQAGEELCPGS